MNATEFQVTFSPRAAMDLADNEKVALWEPTGASLHVDDKAIHLNGKWKVSAIGNFLGSGLLGYFLIRPLFMKDRSETIPFQVLERLVIHTKKGRHTYHLFQSREEGLSEVHVFTADAKNDPALMQALKSSVPSHLLKEESAS
jgi:hypothetical protein